MRIIAKYGSRRPQYSIRAALDVSHCTVEKVLKQLVNAIPETNFENQQLGGPGIIVQVDETMMNYKAKSHRGRSAKNHTDSLCMVEFIGNITRCYATVIPNKLASTLVPIIISQVSANSIIWTDEHRSYSRLKDFFVSHQTVCHKYEFVNSVNGVNTQAIESFHNEMKLRIKARKGILNFNRQSFLKEFCFYFNNRKEFFCQF